MLKKIIIICIFLMIIPIKIFATSESFKGIDITENGDIVVAGKVYSTDIEGIELIGSSDAAIVKYDKNGSLLWNKNYGEISTDSFEDIVVTNDGNYIAVGYSSFDSNTNSYNTDGIITKYDEDGNLKWGKRYGNEGEDKFNAVTELSDGSIVAVGYGLLDHQTDALVVKYDSQGNIVLETRYGGSKDDMFYGINKTSDGGFIAVGTSHSTDIEGLDNHSSSTSTGATVVKFDNNGNVEWQKAYGTSPYDYFHDVIETTDGYIVVGYEMYASLRTLVVKYDFDGNIIWQKGYGEEDQRLYSVDIDENGNIVTVGWDHRNNENGEKKYYVLVLKYSKDGELINFKSLGGDEADEAWAVVTIGNEYVVAGSFSSENFEGLQLKGTLNAFSLKYNENDENIWKISWGGSVNPYTNQNSGETGVVENPKTGYFSYCLIGFIIVCSSIVILYFMKNKKAI